ncbi:MAG TPA: helix-turn-helix transcriptional regulator [Cyclobacteriaceae bacterium]|jgi:transcriptional regulator with XRE-family HTH domain|nr:helix-turn-helix transcriptional regulator [Cyclobacteriaceae bacterium]
MTLHTRIGKNLAALRDKRELSQDEIAKYLHVNRVMISYYENGERPIPILHLEKLADLYGIEVSDLLEESIDTQKVNYAFAFRTTGLSESDLQSIAEFQRIVKNYLKLKSIKDE